MHTFNEIKLNISIFYEGELNSLKYLLGKSFQKFSFKVEVNF